MTGVLIRREKGTRDVHAQRKVLEDTERRQPSAGQAKRPQEKIILLFPWSWTFSLQNCKKINFCCLGHQSVVFCYGISSRLIHKVYRTWNYLLFVLSPLSSRRGSREIEKKEGMTSASKFLNLSTLIIMRINPRIKDTCTLIVNTDLEWGRMI